MAWLESPSHVERDGTTGIAIGGAARWALVFAAWETFCRALVLLTAGVASAADLVPLAASFAEHLLYGVGLGFLVLRWVSRTGVVLSRLLVLVVLAVNSMAFHYEAVFARLPTAGVLFYLRDLGELGPSLVANGPLLILAVEILVGAAVLELVAHRVRSPSTPLLSARLVWCALTACLAVVILVHLSGRGRDKVHGSRLRAPLTWLAESALRRSDIHLEQSRIGPQSVLWFQQALGHERPFGGAMSRYPLCAPGVRGERGSLDHRSAILLVLESVGTAELEATRQGQPVMPRLRAFAERHLLLTDIKAAGTKSGSAMPALFCGLPPQTHAHPLHRVPLNTLRGFPEDLQREGYRTAYFHGADLSWEFQRSFLRMVGIEEIFERDPSAATPVHGWGYSDEEMLLRLMGWVQEHRAENTRQPFFTTLFTLSSHDPYDLPEVWTRRFEGNDAEARLHEALTYLDVQLGRFFEWYEATEAPRGTVLVLVGDHTPHLMNTVATDHGPVYRFEVPMVIAAPELRERVVVARRGAQHDLPATLMSLLGVPPSSCDQGIDLLLPDDRWPEDRILYSVGGEDLEEIQVWSGVEHVLVDRVFRGVRVLTGGDVEVAAEHGVSPRLLRFLEVLIPLNRYLMVEDAYAPPRDLTQLMRAPLAVAARPLFVSHRGNVSGPETLTTENTAASVAAAFSAGFDAVEVDLQLTADQVPVLRHDPIFTDSEGRQREILALDLDELRSDPAMASLTTLQEVLDANPGRDLVIEMKPQREFKHKLALGEAVAAIVRREAASRRVIVDSFSLVQVSAAGPTCDCEVAWDLPFREPVTDELLRAAVLAGVHWIFAEHSVVTSETVAAAHELGLRVMIYTPNDLTDLDHLGSEPPDGVITDTAKVMQMWEDIR